MSMRMSVLLVFVLAAILWGPSAPASTRFIEVVELNRKVHVAIDENGWFHVLGKRPLYAERYDGTDDFQEGMARVRKGGKEFHVGLDGKPAYMERYDHVGGYSNGRAIVMLNGEVFYIDRNGRRIVDN